MLNEKIKINVPNTTLAPIIEQQLCEGKKVRFAPKGTSMLPLLREGRDTVTLCAITKPLKKYDVGFYKRQNGQYVLHRIVKVKDTISCIGDNQFTLENGLSASQFIGIVCEFSRDDKTYSVSNLRYKLYCRCLHLSRPFRYLIHRIYNKLKNL